MQFMHPEFNYTVCSFAIKELFSYGKSDREAIVQKKTGDRAIILHSAWYAGYIKARAQSVCTK